MVNHCWNKLLIKLRLEELEKIIRIQLFNKYYPANTFNKLHAAKLERSDLAAYEKFRNLGSC